MVLVTEECDLVALAHNYLHNAITSDDYIVIPNLNYLGIFKLEENNAFVEICRIAADKSPRCYTWCTLSSRGREGTASLSTQVSAKANIIVKHLCVGYANGAIILYKVDATSRRYDVQCEIKRDTPSTQLLWLQYPDDFKNAKIVIISPNSVSLMHMSITSEDSGPVLLCASDSPTDLNIPRPLTALFDNETGSLIIVRKTGECIVMKGDSKAHFLPSHGFNERKMVQPLSASLSGRWNQKVHFGIMFECEASPIEAVSHYKMSMISSTNTALPPNGDATTGSSMITVVSSEEIHSTTEVLSADFADMMLQQPRPRGSFPHALPGQSIHDALYVPLAISHDVSILNTAKPIDVKLPSASDLMTPPIRTSSNVLDSLMKISVASDASTSSAMLNQTTFCKGSSAKEERGCIMGIYGIDGSSSRIMTNILVEMKKFGILTKKSDLWAYHEINRQPGADSPLKSCDERLIGVLAIASTINSSVHLLLQYVKGGDGEDTMVFRFHMTIELQDDHVSSGESSAVCKGLGISPAFNGFRLWILMANKTSKASLASASTTRRYRTELLVYSNEELNINPSVVMIVPPEANLDTEKSSDVQQGEDTVELRAEITPEVLLRSIVALQEHVMQRFDRIDTTLKEHGSRLDALCNKLH